MATASDAQWSSRTGFLMAAIGFAVGLGNIWRFPYITGENGGGAFVAVYLLCAVGIGVPILMAEVMVGRLGRGSPMGSMRTVAGAEGRSPQWRWLGGVNLATAYLIEVVYCGIAGWVLWYLYKAVTTGFVGVDAVAANAEFAGVLLDVPGMLFWTLTGLGLTGTIVYFGVQAGIERAVRVLMPTLFGLLVVLAGYNVVAGGFPETLSYLFTPDFSKVDGPMVLAAVGQAFFSIGVAMAGMMTFGAYLPADVSIARSALIIVFADTVVALVAGLVIFPVVFEYALDPGGGAGLIFQTLPVAFAQMPGGWLVAIAFFTLLAVAAITSMVGLIEPVVAWLAEHRNMTRHRAVVLVIGSIGTLSIFSILSYNVLSGVKLAGVDLNGILDYLSNQIMLPLGGLAIAVFVGWFVRAETARTELAMSRDGWFALWRLLIRYLVPPAVFVIFVFGVLQ